MENINFSGYNELITKRQEKAKENRLQSTMHQQDAIDTAKMFNDIGSIGIYMGIFKRHNYPYRKDLLVCRDWVLSRVNCENRGRLFVSVYRKFLKLHSPKELTLSEKDG